MTYKVKKISIIIFCDLDELAVRLTSYPILGGCFSFVDCVESRRGKTYLC